MTHIEAVQVQKLFGILIDFNIYIQHLKNPVCTGLWWCWWILFEIPCRFEYCHFRSIFRIVGVLEEIAVGYFCHSSLLNDFFQAILMCLTCLTFSVSLSPPLCLFRSCVNRNICSHKIPSVLCGNLCLSLSIPLSFCAMALCSWHVCCSGAASSTRQINLWRRQQFCNTFSLKWKKLHLIKKWQMCLSKEVNCFTNQEVSLRYGSHDGLTQGRFDSFQPRI